MENSIEFIYAPWPWYIAGPLMGATIPLLLFWGNKMLGASSSLRHFCAMIPNRIDYFQYEAKDGLWNILFVLGVLIGSAITYKFFYQTDAAKIAAATKEDLNALGISDLSGLIPMEIFSMNNFWTVQGLLFTLGGGFLVGFGVRYAGGCTSGHGFMGLSQLSLSSLIAIVAFFAGGVLSTFFFLPLLI